MYCLTNCNGNVLPEKRNVRRNAALEFEELFAEMGREQFFFDLDPNLCARDEK